MENDGHFRVLIRDRVSHRASFYSPFGRNYCFVGRSIGDVGVKSA